MDEPVADAVRSILDGHIVLSRSLAHRNHYPAIDVLKSVSRCMSDVTAKEHRTAAGKLLNAMAIYADAEDMVNLGAYVRGTNPHLDQAIAIHAEIDKFLIQAVEDRSEFKATVDKVSALAGALEEQDETARMKSFKFEMEQVLRMKRWREEEAKKALALEVQALETLKTRLRELENERTSVLDSGETEKEDEIDYRGRLGILQYARFMGTKIEGQHGEIAAQGEKLKEKSDLLLKAMQERKVLEKLKERRVKEYRVLRNRHEYANLDESSAGFLRRAAESRGPAEGIPGNLIGAMSRLRLAASALLLCGAFLPALAITHHVDDFRLDSAAAASDTALHLDRGWGDSLLIEAKFFTYTTVLNRNLSDAGASHSTINGYSGRFAGRHLHQPIQFQGGIPRLGQRYPQSQRRPASGTLANPANIVIRKVLFSPDTIAIDPISTSIAGRENGPTFSAPYSFNFAAEGDQFSAYWGSLTNNVALRRTTHKDTVPGNDLGGRTSRTVPSSRLLSSIPRPATA